LPSFCFLPLSSAFSLSSLGSQPLKRMMRISLSDVASLLACAGVVLAAHDSSLRPPHLSRRAVSCSKTADCTAAGVAIPSNSHQYCSSKVCSFSELTSFPCSSTTSSRLSACRSAMADSRCPGRNTNYSLLSGACVKSVTSTPTTSSAAPSSTIKSCSKTADCEGEMIPANSHQYCRSKLCSFSEFSSGFDHLKNGDSCDKLTIPCHRVTLRLRRLQLQIHTRQRRVRRISNLDYH